MSTDELNQPEVLIFFLSGDKIVDLYNKLYIKNETNLPFDILSGKHTYAGYNMSNGKDRFGIDPVWGVNNNNANEDFKKIISNFWMLVPEMKIEFNNNSILVQLINKMNLLIPEDGLNIVPDMIHNNDNIVVKDMSPGDGELYVNSEYGKNKKTYYSDDKLYNNMQYFIVPNTDIDGLKENIQSSFKTNQNVTCNITCKFINVDILQTDNIAKYTQLFTSGKITKVFIGDDFFDKAINNLILSNLLTEQKKLQNTPEVILLPCLQNKSSNNEINETSIAELNNKLDIELNTKLNTEFNDDNNNCADTNFISIVLNKFYTTTKINRIEESGGKRRKSTKKTKKTKKTRKPRKKSRKSRKHKKSRKH
jgi:hypothetical protein